jgi:hypothetical protein
MRAVESTLPILARTAWISNPNWVGFGVPFQYSEKLTSLQTSPTCTGRLRQPQVDQKEPWDP